MSEERHARYGIRKDREYTWEIYDTRSGRTTVIEGKPRAGLKLDQADAMVDLMNSEGVEPDEVTTH